jgi:hypothetical protein
LCLLGLALCALTGCLRHTAAPAACPPPPLTFMWSETPTLDQIPASPITGMINGKPFIVKMVRVDHKLDDLWLDMADAAPAWEAAIPNSKVEVELSIKIPQGTASSIVKALKDPEDATTGHPWYHYKVSGSKNEASKNPPWAGALEIDEWKMAPPSYAFVTGHLKGKVAICFNDGAKSWVAGTFDCIEISN